ncbi:SAV_2336 N-terminal domain-related protein [Actinomadura decatromicini]|uniref:Glycosyltransferase n=1 Tax=Actinomadura decatromicini TaxID=2604572 RepID=A0A5D3FYW8_9ACTN|nr:SAV_2336 N-terminal domain-related protein [Actinomadura decatromicini]TYK53126.1 glycosyltransferase [Actinomadura decatromicini]
MSLERFLEALGALGIEANEHEVAEALWLAVKIGSAETDSLAAAHLEFRPEPQPPPSLADRPSTPPSDPAAAAEFSEAAERQGPAAPTADLYPAAQRSKGTGTSAVTVRSPTVSPLPDGLNILRALRPLKFQVPDDRNPVLDEEATAERIATDRLRLPVMVPEPRRWLTLTLVADVSPSMAMWQSLVRELRDLTERLGAFRDIRLRYLHTEPNGRLSLRSRLGLDGPPCDPRELIDPTGHQMICVISDCVDAKWQTGSIYELLQRWGRSGPLTILQPLPQRLWKRTGPVTRPARMHLVERGLPNSRLQVTPRRRPLVGTRRPRGIPVPVLQIDSDWLAPWARLVAGSAPEGIDGIVMWTGENPRLTDPVVDEGPVGTTPTERVVRFKSASPQAYKLAGYFSVVPLTLPVMRIVQRLMLPESNLSHLAEVFDSGLLRIVSESTSDPEQTQYDFDDGIRSVLLGTVRRSEAVRVAEEINDFITTRIGGTRTTHAVLPLPGGGGDEALEPSGRPFASFPAEVLRRLGGDYASLVEAPPDGDESAPQAGTRRTTEPYDAVPDLGGGRRREVAHELWAHRGAAVITGISGAGKSLRLVKPLLSRYLNELGRPVVSIDVPERSTDMEQDLVGLLVDGLVLPARDAVAPRIVPEHGFKAVVRALLDAQVLVVIDEFQRLLDAEKRPREPFGSALAALARTPGHEGGLWLVSNQHLDSLWAQPFHRVGLPTPEVDEGVGIVLGHLETADAAARFPESRRTEIVKRLGQNPRVLHLLGSLLRRFTLDELLGPPTGENLEGELVEWIERGLVAKATEGLANDQRDALRRLSILSAGFELELAQALVGDSKDSIWEFGYRYLIEPTQDKRLTYRLHPAVREVENEYLRRDERAWRSAHRAAGQWYAGRLKRSGAEEQALALSGAFFHLREAGADRELTAAIAVARAEIERRYGGDKRHIVPESAWERDARIGLLAEYLVEPGAPGVEYHMARLLQERFRETGDSQDGERALSHAERAATGWPTGSAVPWVMWMKLVTEVRGFADAEEVGRRALAHKPYVGEQRFAVYMQLSICLTAQERVEEAVAELRKGCAEAKPADQRRLADQAVLYAAAEPSDDLLRRTRDWLKSSGVLDYQARLAEILLLQHQGKWRESADLARQSRTAFPKPYLHFPVFEAIGRIGDGDPAAGLTVLQEARIPGSQRASHRSELREGKAWLRALAALQSGELDEASRFLGIYLGTAHPPTTAEEIRAVLLTEWDTRVAIPGEATPSFITPILPAAVTGLPESVRRPQYGPRVLDDSNLDNGGDQRQVVLAVATEWSSSHGGLSTFNRQLCAALARSGMRVFCMTPNPRPEEITDAADSGVALVGPASERTASEFAVLENRPEGFEDLEPDFIIGHGLDTGQAALAQDDRFPRAKRLHFIHFAPQEIDWFELARDEDGRNVRKPAEQRMRIEVAFARSAYQSFAVGNRLHRQYARIVDSQGNAPLACLNPGFDAADLTPRDPPRGRPRVLLYRRGGNAELEGIDLAARALDQVAAALRDARPANEVELVVRGAPEDSSAELRQKIMDWSDHPALGVIVRGDSPDGQWLADDLSAASLVLMPSRTEGFGLVGVEAIGAGTPVLVSSKSGLALLLTDLLKEEARHLIVPTRRSDADSTEEWARRIQNVLDDREAAFDRATEIRRVLAEKWTWAMAIENLKAALAPRA